MSLPIVDIGDLVAGRDDDHAGRAIDAACRDQGFFMIAGHGIDPTLRRDLEANARAFFALADADKEAVAMRHAGSAWRGWFPLGGELTSGRPDGKEGLYFGIDHGPDHPRVRARQPLHGRNLFPADPLGLEPTVKAWLEAVRPVADAVMRGIALGLGLGASWFERTLTADPTVLFRIFRYPPDTGFQWGVQEHTDYGLLTLLAQDANPGLQVRSREGWVDVPAEPELIVCNIGDMLERLTEGRYRSTPHRVRNHGAADRLSFPYFFDPSWDAEVVPVPLDGSAPPADPSTRWDAASPLAWDGTYGEYLTAKVARVFPDLFAEL